MLIDVPESADRRHAPSEDLGFCESLGFRLVQPGKPGELIGLMVRFNLRPNQSVMDVGIDVLLEDGGLLAARHVDSMEAPDAALDIQGAALSREGDLWRLNYDGPAHALDSCRNADDHEFWHKSRLERLIVELEFLPDADGVQLETRPETLGALVQARGEVWVSGDEYQIAGPALRDRHWGSAGIPRARRRLDVCFAEGRALSLERLWTAEGPHLSGWLRIEGETREIVSGRIETEPEADKPYPKAMALSLVDSSRERHRLTAKVLHTAPLVGSTNNLSYMSCQSLTAFSWDDLEAYGFAEYLHTLDENGDPLIPTDV
jgi:hypothetical protein